jgi:BirA family biotin operon repressor/biotin-[acetyl-CoA-carboxylase] ligase
VGFLFHAAFVDHLLDLECPMPPWLITLDTCASTNTWALTHSEALAHGAVVWTEHQTAGRGRQGRTWLAPSGVLTASFVCDVTQAQRASALSLAAGLAVIHACEDLCPGLSLGLKWPNDVLRDGRKLAGILCERTSGSRPTMIIGVGLNRAPQWGSEAPRDHASLTDHGHLSTLMLIEAIRRYLLEAVGLIQTQGLAPLLGQLRQRDTLRDRQLAIDDAGRLSHGLGAGLDDTGRLLLLTSSGLQAFHAGHIVLKP